MANRLRLKGEIRSLDTEKSARELRQRRSDYRCCIPALAGFVCLHSIVPDGEANMIHTSLKTTIFLSVLAMDLMESLKVTLNAVLPDIASA